MTLDVLAVVDGATPPGRLRRDIAGGVARAADGTRAVLLDLAEVIRGERNTGE